MEGEVVGFEITELRLGLPGSRAVVSATPTKKRRFFESCDLGEVEEEEASTDGMAKKVVVGWPPICTYRKNSFKSGKVIESKVFVKVSMDGAPFLRKIHLKAHKGYSDLSRVLVAMFSNLLLGDGCSNSEYITIYEDNDGDWMLIGDVPWEMFVDSCKRLRIMKRTEAINISTGFGKKITESKSTSSSSRSEN